MAVCPVIFRPQTGWLAGGYTCYRVLLRFNRPDDASNYYRGMIYSRTAASKPHNRKDTLRRSRSSYAAASSVITKAMAPLRARRRPTNQLAPFCGRALHCGPNTRVDGRTVWLQEGVSLLQSPLFPGPWFARSSARIHFRPARTTGRGAL